MLVNLFIRLSTLSLGFAYVACTTPQQQSQLATLHDRMNQMISALYSSPLLSKAKTASEETPATNPESPVPAAPLPQVVFVSPPSFLEAGAQPVDYGYPTTTNPTTRAAWPYSYEYSYQPQFAPPAYTPTLPKPYPEYSRAAYHQLSLPQSPGLPPFPSSMSYSPFSSQYPASFPLPGSQPNYGIAPSLPYPSTSYLPSPAPRTISYPPPMPSLPYPLPSLPYPMPVPYFSPISQLYAPSLPYPSFSLPSPAPYPPAPYPPMSSVPRHPATSYPQSLLHLTPASFPQPSDILPQPQYEYGN